MRYRLGSFQPRPGSSDYARFLADEGMGPPMTRALEEMLRVRLSRPATEGSPSPTDLLQVLEPNHPDRPWVEAIHDRLSHLDRRGLTLRLLACEHEPGPDGFLTLAASAPELRFEVFPGDWMQIGFAAMREGDGSVRAWPRLLREVCANGSLVCAGEFEAHEGMAGIGDAVERFLTLEHYEPAVQALRQTRETHVEDPGAYLDELQRILDHMALVYSYRERITARFRSEGDESAYGVLNAITATARDVDDWGDRLDLEELAGRIAWLHRPVPSRSGGGVLLST